MAAKRSREIMVRRVVEDGQTPQTLSAAVRRLPTHGAEVGQAVPGRMLGRFAGTDPRDRIACAVPRHVK